MCKIPVGKNWERTHVKEGFKKFSRCSLKLLRSGEILINVPENGLPRCIADAVLY